MKTNIHKDKRAWWLTHEALLLLQELAHQQGLLTAAYLEVISRELALQQLSEEQRGFRAHPKTIKPLINSLYKSRRTV